MLLWRFTGPILLANLIVMGTDLALAQHDFPNKPIRIITGAPGSNIDLVARLIAPAVSGVLGQPMVVDNRPGLAAIPATVVAKSAPDGYTLLVSSNALWTLPLLQKTPYDPINDFAPISLLAGAPLVLAVHPSLPIKSVKDLIFLAKARPGELDYASGPIGGPTHLAAELFKSMAGVNIVRITYKGTATAITAVVGGEVQLTIEGTTTIMPLAKLGKLKALAITSARPSALIPDLPTVASAVPGYESGSMQAMFAPAKTSATIIARLNEEIVRFLNREDVKKGLLVNGAEVIASSPEQATAKVKSEIVRWSKVINDAGIKVD